MNYLEVKYEVSKTKDVKASDFISNVINSQEELGKKNYPNSFQHKKLLELGFIYNKTTEGYSLVKEFKIKELKDLAMEVNKLHKHILTHSYIVLKIYDEKLYFWDTALIYEGVDTFEYCLKHHNIFDLKDVHVVTKSDSVNEELLNLAGYTKRFFEPTLGFITQGCVWDKKEGYKIQKNLVNNINEYIAIEDVIAY